MIFGFLSRRRNKNCRRYRQQMVSFRQKHVELRRMEVMNKTVHQPSNHCNWMLSLAPMSLSPHVFVILLTIANDDVPTYGFLFSQNCKQYTHKYSTYRVAQHDHTSSREHAWLKGAQLRVARIGVLEMNVIHVSRLIPCRT